MSTRTRRSRSILPVVCGIIYLSVLTCVPAGESVVGTWEFKYQVNDMPVVGHVTFTAATNGNLSATWKPQWPEGSDDMPFDPSQLTYAMSQIKLEEGKLTFHRVVDSPEFTFGSDFQGQLEGDRIEGVFESDWGEVEAKATRMEEACPAVGTWTITFDVPERQIEAKLEIEEDDDGTLSAAMTEEQVDNKLSNVKFDAGKLTFDRVLTVRDMGDMEMEMTFAGTIEDDQLKGAWENEMMGRIDVMGKRAE